jgi:hypothetical protein
MNDKLPTPTTPTSMLSSPRMPRAKAFARLVRASRGAYRRPLHPRLASSLLFRRAGQRLENQNNRTTPRSQLTRTEVGVRLHRFSPSG